MSKKPYFRLNQLVISRDFFGNKIIGEYRGRANVYGCYIYGKPVGLDTDPQIHKCLVLTLESAPAIKRGRPIKYTNKILEGDPCAAFTKRGLKISGFFVQSEGKHSWIKGWAEGVSKFEPKQVYKVQSSTLVSLKKKDKDNA